MKIVIECYLGFSFVLKPEDLFIAFYWQVALSLGDGGRPSLPRRRIGGGAAVCARGGVWFFVSRKSKSPKGFGKITKKKWSVTLHGMKI